MLFCDFHANLKKLNRRLWVDVNHETRPYHKDFPIAGLYCDDKYLFGVPHDYVPEYSIEESNSNRLLARGYRATLADLCRRGLIDKRKAERLFGINIEDKRINFPRRLLDLGMEAG